MLPNLSKSVSQKANYLTVPNAATGGGAGGGGTGSGAGPGGMIKNAFTRLVSGNWYVVGLAQMSVHPHEERPNNSTNLKPMEYLDQVGLERKHKEL